MVPWQQQNLEKAEQKIVHTVAFRPVLAGQESEASGREYPGRLKLTPRILKLWMQRIQGKL